MIFTSKLTSKSQVVVPSEVRERLGLKPGDRGVWVLRDGEAVLMSAERYARSTAGILAGTYGRSPEEVERYLERERESWAD
jgi:AbrB family looped-hinge helix DNA binding protein